MSRSIAMLVAVAGASRDGWSNKPCSMRHSRCSRSVRDCITSGSVDMSLYSTVLAHLNNLASMRVDYVKR